MNTMNGKLNCSMTAENAAFTKIRALEKQIKQLEADVSKQEDEIDSNKEAVSNLENNLSEKVETKAIEANTIQATEINTNSSTTKTLNAEGISATNANIETITADRINNVDTYSGVTVDVNKVISDVAKINEVNSNTVNSTNNKSDELTVNKTTNLNGQVNIDGNMTFTKDNGLSELSGEYLQINAAKATIENKSDGYALYVPGIKGDALFGGSLTVQDTLLAKNLAVIEKAVFPKGAKLENVELENPTITGIEESTDKTNKALDIVNGKLVRKNIEGQGAGTGIADTLICNKKVIVSSEIGDTWKRGNDILAIPISDATALLVNSSSINEVYCEINGDKTLIPDMNMYSAAYSVAHIDAFGVASVAYAVFDETAKTASIRHFNIKNGTVEILNDKLDISQFFDLADASVSTFWENFISAVDVQPATSGLVLRDDTPTFVFKNTSSYIDIDEFAIKTNTETFDSTKHYILTKNGFINVSLGTAGQPATNNKYNSSLGIASDTKIKTITANNGKYVVIDAPTYVMDTTNKKLYWLNDGVEYTQDISDSTVKSVGTYDEDGNTFIAMPAEGILISGNSYATNTYLSYGYTKADYIVTVTADEQTVYVDGNKAEMFGYQFANGEWWDYIASTSEDFFNFIFNVKHEDYKTYKILANCDITIDSTAITSSSNINYNKFNVYSIDSHSLEVTGTPGTRENVSMLMSRTTWNNYAVTIDLFFSAPNTNGAPNFMSDGGLCLNNCSLSFTMGNTPTKAYKKLQFGLGNSNNVTCNSFNVPTTVWDADTTGTEDRNVTFNFNKCSNIYWADINYSQTYYPTYSFSNVRDAFIKSYLSSKAYSATQNYGGYNIIYNTFNNEIIQPTIS